MKFMLTLGAPYQLRIAIKTQLPSFRQIIINHVTFSVGQETAF